MRDHSLGSAIFEIDELLKGEMNGLSESQIIFLTNFKQLLENVVNEVNSSYQKVVASNLNNDNLVSAYLKEMQRQMEFSQQHLAELLAVLQNELKRSIQNNTSNKIFEEKISSLMHCCLGVLNNSASVEQLLKQKKYFTQTYDYLKNTGCPFVPYIQQLDVFEGTKVNEIDRHIVSDGKCYGRIIDWVHQLSQSGKYSLKMATDKSIYYHQSQAIDYKNDAIFNKRQSEFAYVHRGKALNYSSFDLFIPKENDLNIYSIQLYPKNIKVGHEVGIRRIPNTGEIEFFDPNHGIFIAKDEKQFKFLFSLILNDYRLSGQNFDRMSSMKVGVQPSNAVAAVPHRNNSSPSLTYDFVSHLLDKFNNYYLENFNSGYGQAQGKPPFSKEDLAKYFLDIYESCLNCIDNKSDLSNFKSLIFSNLLLLQSKKSTSFMSTFFEFKPENLKKKMDELFSSRMAQLHRLVL